MRAHLATCAEAHDEIAELGGVLPALAESVPVVEPPEGLKARIMAAAAADLEERTAGVATTGATASRRRRPPSRHPFPTASERTERKARTSARDLDPAHRGGRRDRGLAG